MNNLTIGSVPKTLLQFSIPYLISCFLQTFYGLADLFITGQFNGAGSISAVSIGSQVMHMVTVIVVGLAMGSTVLIGRRIGANDKKSAARSVGNSITFFLLMSIVLTILFIAVEPWILRVLSVPEEAHTEAYRYLMICFAGIPFITAYNVISSIFRGLGDTKRPMIFVLIAGMINVVLDYILIGPMGMGAAGAALATTISQAASVLISLIALTKMKTGIHLTRSDLKPEKKVIGSILGVGFPIACQDGLIQISFIIITIIANTRGVEVSAAVGIVEKIISFLFLVPSAMNASIASLNAQSNGAGMHKRSSETLRWALLICTIYSAIVIVICEFAASPIVSVFTSAEPEVVRLGAQYLRTYVVDTLFASYHFCMSGFFCAYNKAVYSFIHNIISVIAVRIPGALLATILFPATLYAMGSAAPLGSFLSTLICVYLYMRGAKKHYWG